MSVSSPPPVSRRRRAAKTPARTWLILLTVSGGIVLLGFVVRQLFFAPPTVKIEDLVIGSGAEAQIGDTLQVHYTGWLLDGTQFDSSRERNQPIEFTLGEGEVIAGWEKGLIGMRVGGKRRLTIPPSLGHGSRGVAGSIPPNATLIFEIELLAIKHLQTIPTLEPITQLKIEDVVVGTGDPVKKGDTLRVHYTGWLPDGTQFDSSLERGQPFEFTLGQGMVIEGWEQGLLGMRVGGKRHLYIPPELGYGASGVGNVIPPNSSLVFEVELLAIIKSP